MTEKEKIHAKVAQIINDRQLVLNKGSDSGVIVGMRFAILDKEEHHIPDPDTGETLGSIPVPKAIVKIVQTEERMSIASTFRTYVIPGGALANITKILDASRPSETRHETLNTDVETYKDRLKRENLYVRIGDPATSFEGDEFSGWSGT